MENMTPSMSCLIIVLRTLAEGKSLKQGVDHYIANQPGKFANQLALWLHYFSNDRLQELPNLDLESDCQRAVLDCLEAGFRGFPIQSSLKNLLLEAETAAKIEVQEYLALLPLRALLPLFLFQFPAFIAIIFGPLLLQMFTGVSDV